MFSKKRYWYRLHILDRQTGDEVLVETESRWQKVGLGKLVNAMAPFYGKRYDGVLLESNDESALEMFKKKCPTLEIRFGSKR